MERSDPVDHILAKRGICKRGLGARSMNECRSYRIHVDVVFAPLDCQALGQMTDAGLGHAVHGFDGQCSKSRLRAHVNDASTILADHDPARSLTSEKCALEINGERAIEVFFSNVLC